MVKELRALPMEVRNIIESIILEGFVCFIVGGYVRDIQLGLESKDIDLATNAHPEDLIKLFPPGEYRVNEVGKSFGVIMINGIEVSTFRKDRYTGLSDKDVEITYSNSIREDLQRRDLTINAMALNPITNKVIDPFGGKNDLKERIIRFVGDPEVRIYEDPNRIIRACRFVSTISGNFDFDTHTSLIKNITLIEHISPERIRLEILKAMKIKKASYFFCALQAIGALKYIFYDLDKCWNHPHGKHHPENIFEHSMNCGDDISIKYPLLKLSAYLHDVGKPESCIESLRQRDYDDIKFIDHEKIGSEILKKELNLLTFSNEEVSYISGVTRIHMRQLFRSSSKSKRKFLRELEKHHDDVPLIDLLRLQIADRRANENLNKIPFTFSEIKKTVKEWKDCKSLPEAAFGIKNLDINGKEVMDICELTPGPTVGLYLEFLLMKVINDPSLNNNQTLRDILKENILVVGEIKRWIEEQKVDEEESTT